MSATRLQGDAGARLDALLRFVEDPDEDVPAMWPAEIDAYLEDERIEIAPALPAPGSRTGRSLNRPRPLDAALEEWVSGAADAPLRQEIAHRLEVLGRCHPEIARAYHLQQAGHDLLRAMLDHLKLLDGEDE